MLKALASLLFFLLFFLSISAAENGFPRCNCDEEGSWSIDTIMECQRVSDFLIAVAYFSIPVELLYFVSCSTIPFKWVLFQFISFIVLCGMTHLLNGWTYGPHPFQLMLALTIFKLLTALVSFATAITLITLIPLLLKVKVRELMLKKKTWDLDREVGLIKKQKEAGWHVRMLTQEIRKSLDRHTILYTTLVELSKTLNLQNCAVWMPNVGKTEMDLTHELKGRDFSSPIPTSDHDVRVIKGKGGVKILNPQSALAAASSGGMAEPGSVAAIRMPMLRVSNFKGGTPEMVQACYAILVLVLPGGQGRSWSSQELEIVEVVADQVAVALSHASVLEESQIMREKLEDQNRALQQAKQDALKASQARNAFQMVMSNGLRRPMHSVLGLLSVLQDENLKSEQRLLVDTMQSAEWKQRRREPYVTSVFSKWNSGTKRAKTGPQDSNSSDGYLHMRVEVGVRHTASQAKYILPEIPFGGYKYRDAVEEGLSFSACRKLVQLMQGDIWVISDPEGFDRSMALVLRFRVRGLKVLLADPNDVNRAVTRKFLEKLGCIVSTVSSGYECLSALGPLSSCQIVLLDLHLPDVDGLEVAMRLRKFQSYSSPLIVALTANDDEDTRFTQTGCAADCYNPCLKPRTALFCPTSVGFVVLMLHFQVSEASEKRV
ncbi:UNVERIFIED_CONTAM: Ethylene receptor 2 [Sesamum calycinum]|uniref:Ethylene receptor 2 n=1 Tax=Sesamum calycinum TaxID=2727403 RepID=A0AAW2QKU7_9LAMI